VHEYGKRRGGGEIVPYWTHWNFAMREYAKYEMLNNTDDPTLDKCV